MFIPNDKLLNDYVYKVAIYFPTQILGISVSMDSQGRPLHNSSSATYYAAVERLKENINKNDGVLFGSFHNSCEWVNHDMNTSDFCICEVSGVHRETKTQGRQRLFVEASVKLLNTTCGITLSMATGNENKVLYFFRGDAYTSDGGQIYDLDIKYVSAVIPLIESGKTYLKKMFNESLLKRGCTILSNIPEKDVADEIVKMLSHEVI